MCLSESCKPIFVLASEFLRCGQTYFLFVNLSLSSRPLSRRLAVRGRDGAGQAGRAADGFVDDTEEKQEDDWGDVDHCRDII